MRLDLAVSRRFGLSRRAAREAVRTGRIDVEGTARDEPGAEVLVVDKPAGLLAVPTAAKERDTLLSRVSLYLQHRYRRRPYVGVVHRLDRDTSGALVFARSRDSLRFLQRLFAAHAIEREYVALVAGAMSGSGALDAPLSGDGESVKRRVARPGERGRRAVTRYRVLERLPGATLVSVELETGRTHQIRIHFADAGHPVLGDRVYGPPEAAPSPAPPRQMLHARRLGFPHPAGSAAVRVESGLPDDFAAALAAMRRAGGPPSRKEKRPGSVRGASEFPRGRTARRGR